MKSLEPIPMPAVHNSCHPPAQARAPPPMIDSKDRVWWVCLGVLAGLEVLRALAVEYARFAALASKLPAGLPTIAESGIDTVEQLYELVSLGYSGALIGSALMQAATPAEQLARFIAAGRDRADEDRPCS